MTNLLIEELKKVKPNFSESELKKGLDFFEFKNIKAKSIIAESGKVCDYLFFTDKSITRCFYLDSNGNEQTLWMKPEQTFLTEYKSFVSELPSDFSLQVYEDSNILCINRKNLLKLYSESIEWAQFGVSLTENLHVTLIDVFVNLLANDATKNYQYIEYMFPRFIQVAPLKDIASMLQITPVSLSRIRAGKQSTK
jgi:CRP-like cAMP-binding protein